MLNGHVNSGGILKIFKWAFCHVLSGNWHPLGIWLLDILDCQLYGLKPWGHHLTSLLFHAANTVLLFLWLHRLDRGRAGGALWVAAIFAFHPLHVESVAWVAERKRWGTVREDYSPGGTAWEYFPHDHARSRAYRWGEDGMAGFSDGLQRLCLSLALWNGKDPILKERLFGLTNAEGNHGEDVKELYYYLDATPTHSYLKMLYKYPQRNSPMHQLMEGKTAKRGKNRSPNMNCWIRAFSTTTAISMSSWNMPRPRPTTS